MYCGLAGAIVAVAFMSGSLPVAARGSSGGDMLARILDRLAPCASRAGTIRELADAHTADPPVTPDSLSELQPQDDHAERFWKLCQPRVRGQLRRRAIVR